MIRISLVVATYNRGEQLLRTLRSITRQTLDTKLWEAIVVNNNSTDTTERLFEDFREGEPAAVNIKMVFEGQQGLSHARNRGIAESSGEIVAFADDDEELNPDFLKQYLDFFEAHPEAAAGGGRIQPHYEYETPKWLSPWLERPLSALIDMGDKPRLFKGRRYPIGGNMAFRREVFEQWGTFDTELGRTGKKLLSGEEKDIFDRIRREGGKIYWVPGPYILHLIPQSRLTPEYLGKLTKAIGTSERIRTRRSWRKYAGRLFSEGVKWGGTLVLATGYLLQGRPSKGKYLIIMRRNITAGLLGLVKQ